MGTNESVKLCVTAEQPLVRHGIVSILQVDGSLEVTGASFDAVSQCSESAPDVVLCVSEPRPDLADILRRIRSELPDASLACLLLSKNDDAIVTVLRAGASCIVDDGSPDGLTPEYLVEQLKLVACGQFVLSNTAAVRLARMYALPEEGPSNGLAMRRDAALTEREQEVLSLLAEGCTNRDIAEKLSVSEHTVRAHLRGIMQKLNVTNRVQAAVLAWRGAYTSKIMAEARTRNGNSGR
jgi:DNA-binding NarL/FixJ family response regulator